MIVLNTLKDLREYISRYRLIISFETIHSAIVSNLSLRIYEDALAVIVQINFQEIQVVQTNVEYSPRDIKIIILITRFLEKDIELT